ncbi:hypothetical protein DPMN_087916 [Dreissena polymorpha]|uniref:Uncharacterized protein n=1 Tax=Dreissena polymorpha TaxID=45954 RepID=A0A9D4KTV8_DREPO|nr:hypothetical protein DPMN_087916 [Dreissena polymorpha]
MIMMVVEVVVCDDGGDCDDVGKMIDVKECMSLDRHPDWPAKFAQADQCKQP